MRKKEMLSLVMEKSGFNYMVNRLRRILDSKQFTIITYHRIFDHKQILNYKFDDGLISATPEQFDQQLYFIKNNYNVIGFDKLINCIENNEKLDKGSIVITFDDGFEDNYYNAYPILKKYTLPATIFLSVDYIAKKKHFWFDEVVCILKKLSAESISQLNSEIGIVNKINTKNRTTIIGSVMHNLKRVDNSTRLEILNKLKVKYKHEIFQSDDKADDNQYLNNPMTWEHIHEMSKNNIEFGSHTMTHPILSSLNEEELYFELNESHNILNKKNINYVPVLAYPVGGNYAFNEKVKVCARNVGYKLACSYMPGRNMITNCDKYAIKRLPIEKFMGIHYVSSMLALPELFFDKK